MVEVVFFKGNFGYESMAIKGHADFNPGNDIVCSAISALGMALVSAIKNSEDISIRNLVYESGLIVVEINPFIDENRQKIIDEVFKTIYIGLLQVQKTYPDNITVKGRSA